MKAKKLLAAILAVAMILGMISFPAFAEEGTSETDTEVPVVAGVNTDEDVIVDEGDFEDAFGDDSEVASIGETSFSTLAAAIDAAQAGDTIALKEDITGVTQQITINKNITLDLAGHVLRGSVGGGTFVSCNADVKITDTAATDGKKGTISNVIDDGSLVYTVKVESSGKSVEIENVIIEAENGSGNKTATAVYAMNASSVIIKNSDLCVISPYTARGVYMTGTKTGTLKVENSNISVTGGYSDTSAITFSNATDAKILDTVMNIDLKGSTGSKFYGITGAINEENFEMNNCTIQMNADNSSAVAYFMDSSVTSGKNYYSINDGAYSVNGAVPSFRVVYVTGGKYNFPVPGESLKAGLISTETPDANGYYTVEKLTEERAVAKVEVDGEQSTVYYADFSNAVSSHKKDSCTITLLKDTSVGKITTGNEIRVIINKDVVLNCENFNVKHGENNGTIKVNAVSSTDKIELTDFINNGAINFSYGSISSSAKININTGVKNYGTIEANTEHVMTVNDDMDGTTPLETGSYKWRDGKWVPYGNVEIIRDGEHVSFCSTIANAMELAKDGDVVKIHANGSANCNITKSITLDLNGFTVSGSTITGSTGIGQAFTIKDGAVVTVKDSSAADKPVMNDNGDITYKAGIITANGLYDTVCVHSNSTLILESGIIENKYTRKITTAIDLTTTDRIGVENAKFIMNGGAVRAVNGYALVAYGVGDQSKAPSITINDGVVNGYYAAILGNGTPGISGTEININGGELYSKATAVYHPQAGEINVTGGKITGENTGIEMRAGTLNVSGGEIASKATESDVTANGSGATTIGSGIAVAQHSTKLPVVLNVTGGEIKGHTPVYQSNPQNNSEEDIARVSINIEGGNFEAINGGTMSVYSENKTGFITGGTFSHMPNEEYIPEDTPSYNNPDGSVTLGNPTEKIEVVFVATNDPAVYDIVLRAANGKNIYRLNSADLTFEFATEDAIAYEITGNESAQAESTINNIGDDRYEFHYNFKSDTVTGTSAEITIGQVKFVGYGAVTFSVADEDTNAVHATTMSDNIVTDYAVGGGEGKGELVIEGAQITETFAEPTRKLNVKIEYNNNITDKNTAEYNDMTVKVVGINGDVFVGKVGSGEDDAVIYDDDYTADAAEFSFDVKAGYLYTVTVEGAGYRTARYSVMVAADETDDVNLTFWNNVKDVAVSVEQGKVGGEVTKNFLAGDIVKDNKINIYDLSAVVSYFGTENLVEEHPEYARYDLNRDGKIDSKDVAYVLVSWGK